MLIDKDGLVHTTRDDVDRMHGKFEPAWGLRNGGDGDQWCLGCWMEAQIEAPMGMGIIEERLDADPMDEEPKA